MFVKQLKIIIMLIKTVKYLNSILNGRGDKNSCHARTFIHLSC